MLQNRSFAFCWLFASALPSSLPVNRSNFRERCLNENWHTMLNVQAMSPRGKARKVRKKHSHYYNINILRGGMPCHMARSRRGVHALEWMETIRVTGPCKRCGGCMQDGFDLIVHSRSSWWTGIILRTYIVYRMLHLGGFIQEGFPDSEKLFFREVSKLNTIQDNKTNRP